MQFSTKPALLLHPLTLAILLVVSLGGVGLGLLDRYRQGAPGLSPAVPLAADKSAGVNVDLRQYAGDETLATQLDLMAGAGLVWLRQPFLWADIEPARGQFQWADYDAIVNAAGERGFKLIAVLHTSPAWARPDGTPPATPPTEASNLGDFARRLAARYGDRIDAYQVWDEPNLSANWGGAFVDPVKYTWLLREAAVNIRTADPDSIILSAALAPTLENGPLNLNDPAYLEAMYRAGAAEWFDVAAAQAYGFDLPATVGRPRRGELNFARPELLRQVMLAHGDEAKAIWITAYGWNALPEDWSGQESVWESLPPAEAAQETEAALRLARANWPWLGPIVSVRWDTTGLAPTDPARGFALVDGDHPTLLYQVTRAYAARQPVATVGVYPAEHPSGRYSENWRVTPFGADSPHPSLTNAPPTLTLPFEGTRLDLTLRRGNFKGYLWATVDGHPANALPQDPSGRSYIVLYDFLAETDTVTLARHLPDGPHQAVIQAEGGWYQWAIAGWRVSRETRPGTLAAIYGSGLMAVLAAALLLARLRVQGEAGLPAPFVHVIRRLPALAASYLGLGRRFHYAVTILLIAGFYLSPSPLLTFGLLALTGLHVLLRPDLGLWIAAANLSFYLVTRPLFVGNFALVELATLITALACGLRWLWRAVKDEGRRAKDEPRQRQFRLSSLDLAALAFLPLALAATFAADNFGVSMREFRVVVFEPVLFYFLIRTLPAHFRQAPRETAFALWHAFLAGATAHALLALYQYFVIDRAIAAEGVYRALGLYGSPNNLGLLLGRVLPVLVALILWGERRNAKMAETTARTKDEGRRTKVVGLSSFVFRQTLLQKSGWPRLLYILALIPVGLALYLTFSKGALLLGVPASLLAMVAWWGITTPTARRRALGTILGGIALLTAALLPLLRTERFRSTFDLSQGTTSFFRLQLWRSALKMWREHPLLGVGLDNFLYQYRTRYILPNAWQEPNLSHPHNLALDFSTRLGVGGIVLLAWLQWAFWSAALRAYQRLTDPAPKALLLGLMGSMVAFLAHGLVDNSYFLVDLAFTFFLTAGIVHRLAASGGP